MNPLNGRRRPRTLATRLVDAFSARIADGQLPPGAKLPTEAAIMEEFEVSRTVVREALSKLQAAGLVQTRHGIGTFVRKAGEAVSLSLSRAGQTADLLDVVAVLELRLGLEGESAALAAMRRSDAQLESLRAIQRDFAEAIEANGDTVDLDRHLHELIAAAAANPHFVELISKLGPTMIPRARIDSPGMAGLDRREYFRHVHDEHESIVSAIANRDPEAARAAMRTHLSNSRDRLRNAYEAANKTPN